MKRWRVEGEPSSEVLGEIADVLRAGGVALLPTDTIYGLHALATDNEAVARIRSMKERGDEKPFVIIASSAEQLETLGATIPDALRRIWPAPLTAILASGERTIAARVPDLAWLRAFLDRTGPLVSTSANRSGEPPITTPEMLARDLFEALDALLDAGLREGQPSTIVDFTGDQPRLVREGDPGFAQFLRKRLWKEL
ncbi:MAG TPA: L-threonylcarbamoyladenylate synthase [Thermoanaerobaculia bacterium]|jgi:tRNA threonylcarbamoyl adenosine modification protein (Sua5/YciO/YrdC/YwlC family)|nr:L-threonylcarbamoyladenylate synthase [Thermoanaerobaculia bacterium]